MAEVSNDKGGKRQLPLWMLGVTAADHIRKSGSENEIHHSLENEATCKEKSLKEDTGFLLRRETGKRHKKNCSGGSVLNSSTTSVLPKKGKRRENEVITVSKRGDSKKKNHKSCEHEEVSDEIEAPFPSDDEIQLVAEERYSCKAANRKAKTTYERREKELITHEEEESKEEMDFQAQCETSKRTMNASRGVVRAGVKNKRPKSRSNGERRTAREPNVRMMKHMPKTYGIKSGNESQLPSPVSGGSDDGTELTMDDLMSMAEQCVKANKDKEYQKAQGMECNSSTLCCSTSIDRNELSGSFQTNGNIRGISACTRSLPSSDLTVIEEESSTEGVSLNANRTGDPKLDMLDLFLGPLLSKPQTEKKKLDRITENLTYICEPKKSIKSQILLEGEAPLMKKKSSLKEKVAMYLD